MHSLERGVRRQHVGDSYEAFLGELLHALRAGAKEHGGRALLPRLVPLVSRED